MTGILKEFEVVTIPLLTAIVTSSSAFYIATQMQWPLKKELTAITFVFAFVSAWGSDTL